MGKKKMKRITILADAKGTSQIWNNLGVLESIGIKIVDVMEST